MFTKIYQKHSKTKQKIWNIFYDLLFSAGDQVNPIFFRLIFRCWHESILPNWNIFLNYPWIDFIHRVYAIFYVNFIFWRNATIIKMKIEALKERENTQYIHNDLTSSECLDQLAISLGQLYDIYRKYKDLYGIIMLSMLLSTFQYLTLMIFYMILWLIDFLNDLMETVNFELLMATTVVIGMLLLDIFNFCHVSTRCMIEVISNFWN